MMKPFMINCTFPVSVFCCFLLLTFRGEYAYHLSASSVLGVAKYFVRTYSFSVQRFLPPASEG